MSSKPKTLFFCFELVNTKTMQYLTSMLLVNNIKFLYAPCLFLFFKNKVNEKYNFIYLFFTRVNYRTHYIVCVWVFAHAIARISRHSLSFPPAKLFQVLSITPQVEGNYSFLPDSFSENLLHPQQKGVGVLRQQQAKKVVKPRSLTTEN